MKNKRLSLSSYIDVLQSEGQYIFYKNKIRKELKLSENAFKLAMNRLAKQGRAKHIRSGFCIIIPLEYKAVGCLPASWFIDDFMRYLDAKYYVGILTAASLHGAAHQQPMVFQVIADKIIRPIRVRQLRLEFHFKKLIFAGFSNPVKTETGIMQVSTPEMTILDIVRYMNVAGQINNVATILYELQSKINMQQLLYYLEQGYIETSVVQRLGYLLEYLKIECDLTKLAEQVLKNKPCYKELVVGNRTPIIKRSEKWRILVNEIVEPDI